MSFSQLSPAERESLLDEPALQPPEGVTSNFENPPNNSRLSSWVMILCMCVVSIAVLVRFYAKVFKIRAVKVEDVLALLGFGCYLGYVAFAYWRIGYCGTFVHQWDVRLRDLPPILYHTYVCSVFYAATMLAAKPAILLEWMRIFVPTGTRTVFYWACCVALVFNVLYFTAALISANLECIPYKAIWDITISGKCINSKALITTGAAINLVSDIIILLLPQKVIWGLRLSTRKKVGVSMAFAVGIFGCAAAIARLVASVRYTISPDAVYNASEVSLWAIAEMSCTFLVFCVPAFPKAFVGDGVPSRLAASFRSWTNLPKSSRDDLYGRQGLQDQYAKLEGQSHYRKIDENGVALIDIAPRDLTTAHQNSDGGINQSQGVLCTRDFTATEEYVNDNTKQAVIQSQHQYPWLNR